MPRGVPISPSKKGAIAEAAQHLSYQAVADKYRCSKATVSNLVKRKQSTGSVYPSPRQGRALKTSRYDILAIKRAITSNRFLPIAQRHCLIREENGIAISLSTFRRCLRRMGYTRRIARVKPFINKAT